MAVLTDYDWSEIIFDLIRSGMAQHAIAKATGKAAGESAIRQYMSGAVTPLHWRGEIILGLWEEKTGKRRSQAPRRPAIPYKTGKPRAKEHHVGYHAQDHLPVVAKAYGVSVPDLVGMLTGKQDGNLELPGFEE